MRPLGSVTATVIYMKLEITKKAKRIALATLIVLFLFPIVAGIGIFYYNYNLSPPAKLRNKIQIGQSYNQVKVLFEDYEDNYKGQDEMVISEGVSKPISGLNQKSPKGKYLHLYHWILLDDLQLTVYFNEKDVVQHIEYIGD